MPQISKGDTFANNQQLTAARLNQLVDAATITVNVITDQPQISANTLEATDTLIVSDSGVLKKTAVSDIVGSGIPVTTPSITSTANNDLVTTPFDGTSVVGSNYTSTDGVNVIVTTIAAHGLSVNQIITISSAGTGYNGTFKITEVTTYTFKYVLPVAATTLTPTATACTYIRKGANVVNGQSVVTGNSFVNGTANSAAVQTGAISGTSVTADTSAIKTSNVTTAMQYSGTPVWGLASITETLIPFFQCDGTTIGGLANTCNQWKTILTIPSLTKTNKEMWVIDADFVITYYSIYGTRFRIVQNSTGAVYAMQQDFIQAYGNFRLGQIRLSGIVPEGTVFTNDSIRVEAFYSCTAVGASNVLNIGYGGALTDATITRVARLTKYIKP